MSIKATAAIVLQNLSLFALGISSYSLGMFVLCQLVVKSNRLLNYDRKLFRITYVFRCYFGAICSVTKDKISFQVGRKQDNILQCYSWLQFELLTYVKFDMSNGVGQDLPFSGHDFNPHLQVYFSNCFIKLISFSSFKIDFNISSK